MATKLKLGDVVAYRASFLRSIGDYSHARASMRGTITEEGPWLVMVAWQEGPPRGAYHGNLIRADRIHLEPA